MKVVLLFLCLALGETMGARSRRASGGKKISIENAPYYVSLRRSGKHVCGGALISTRHVLTAADCVVDKSFKRLDDTIVVSGTEEYDRADHGYTIETISPHEGYFEERSLYNIAVITLSGHIEFNEKQKEIALPNAVSPHCEHATLTAFQLRISAYGTPGLQEVSVNIQPSAYTDHSDLRLYGNLKRFQYISNVDLGGPLECNNTIIGIASEKRGAIGCYFVNVVKFRTFIEKFIENETPPRTERPTVIKWAPKRPRF